MDKIIRKRRSSPRTFDRNEAIDTAMRLFWRHGYEGVSLNDLVSAIGIAPPSLYAAFGSKAGLYREALDHYFGLPGALSDLPAAETLTETVETLLRRAIDAVTDPSGEKGCMVSSGMLQSASAHAELALELAKRRSGMHDHIAEILARWLDHDRAVSLARYLLAVLQGLSVQARDGATKEELGQVVDQAVAGIRAIEPLRGQLQKGDAVDS
ncbi:TetR family transcriptional regulator [Agrobacterium vitis]|uniref:TetR/AcrR family transcriptional regulator n=1 Tax=Agrobacterium vitis TaxID=373 RepID=UPI0008729FCA|nr:TetR/AcrR family transcriptional regulator [Agrobacterium vitis]MCE6074711.1 TetR family transcriptional regulator [Agrobacterium vitis]MCF1467280.1 TetR/AcrR family transcriptional regulator [Agrobacterium vitis]MCM2467884.1 TetR/AcrR family transcriptional regulator [Agrobacterium vitis]MUO68211.1 TetR family transcriptional regulator [Agrobacterium vitis]MUO83571.1 TetR family transcriptional regulator [Agrobacterium vitis]